MQTFYETNPTSINGKTKRHPLTKIITDVVYKEKKIEVETWTKWLYIKCWQLLEVSKVFQQHDIVNARWNCWEVFIVLVPNMWKMFVSSLWLILQNHETVRYQCKRNDFLLAKNAFSKKVKTVLRPSYALRLSNKRYNFNISSL